MRYGGEVVAIGVLAALLVLAGPARSIFTDVAHSNDNEFGSGEFDIAVSKDGSRFYNDIKLFEFSNLKPGDERTFTFYIKNRGDVDVSRMTMTLNIKDLEESEMSPAEKAVDNTTDVGELSKYLVVNELRVHLGDQSWTVDSTKGRTLSELSGVEIGLLNGQQLKAGEVLEVEVTVRFSEKAGNECQTDKTIVDMELNAEQ